MKNALVITSLVVIISYLIALVAETIGVVLVSAPPAVPEPKPQTDNRSAAHHLTLTSASVRTN